ncbi:MAG: magnesium transporter [Gammaproteobacteria bacterium]|nr:magnesium transporter [Gammaproteobacteria bacterium]
MNTSPDTIAALNQRFLLDHPAIAGKAIEDLPRSEVVAILSEQPVHVLIALWPYLLPTTADDLLPQLDVTTLRSFLYELDPPDCLSLLNRLPAEVRARCLSTLPATYQKELEMLMSFPEHTAGQVMDTRVLMFHPDDTVEEVLHELRKRKTPGLHQVVVVDTRQHLQGLVDIQDIAVSEAHTRLAELYRQVRHTISPFDSREEVADLMKQFNLEMLPVIDVNDRLLGVIRHAALIKVLQEEAANDIQTMVGVSRDERALSSSLFSVRKRLPWMEINLLTAFLAAAVVGLFENTIAKFTALAVLLPVVAGQSGNAGAQAQAVTIRGLALREITIRNWLRIMFKEVNVGLFNGIAIALTTALGVYIWSRSFGLSLIISIAMIISMVIAGIAGSLIPIVLTRFGQDPAQSSSIILTTVTDVSGFMSFLGIATLLSSLL